MSACFSNRTITPLYADNLQLNIETVHPDLYIVFDGFIPGLTELYDQTMSETPWKNSESSVWGLSRALIAAVYMKRGFVEMLSFLKGEYSVVLLDLRDSLNPLLYVASDRVGAYPIYTKRYLNGDLLFSNAQFMDLKNENESMEPGTWELYKIEKTTKRQWSLSNKSPYFSIEKTHSLSFLLSPFHNLMSVFHKEIQAMIPENKKVVCVLSGGLFSSVMAILLSYHVPKLHTVFIGAKNGARGYHSAMMLSERLHTIHTNILVEEMDFCRVTGNVISLLQTADKHAVRNGCVHYVGASVMNDQFFTDEDITVFLGEGGANAFMSCEDEEIYQDMFQFEHLFQISPSYLKPSKTEELVKRMHHIYCRQFGFSLRFPYFNSNLQEALAKYDCSREELVEWLAGHIQETYSEYVTYRSPIVSAFPLGMYYEYMVQQFSKMSEQEYYTTILSESFDKLM
jgi:asparagine synthetase B (glutamine-hydrolysing)